MSDEIIISVVISYGRLSSSQSSEVISVDGVSKTLLAGGHGYADSYILEEQ